MIHNRSLSLFRSVFDKMKITILFELICQQINGGENITRTQCVLR